MHARMQGERGPAMTQVVRPDLRQPKAAHGVGESAGESFRVEHRPVDVAKQEVVSVQPAPISSRSAACRARVEVKIRPAQTERFASPGDGSGGVTF